jgi:predicted patatin/cPLA2 family phospholipase
MTSLQSGIKQNVNDIGYYINVGNMVGKIYAYQPTTAAVFDQADWTATPYGSTISTAGTAVFKDMGKTVVSSLRTFRKVQLVVRNSSALSTFGVGGDSSAADSANYFTGYIELGFEGNGTPAPVAQFGR